MLDQNTDRMWFVIGAVIVGAAIIFIANGSLPTLFASITDTFQEQSDSATEAIDDRFVTIENVIVDGDFSQGLTHWSTDVGYNLRVENNTLWATVKDLRSNARVANSSRSDFKTTDQWYYRFDIKPKYATMTALSFNGYGLTPNLYTEMVANEWRTVSSIDYPTSATGGVDGLTGALYIYHFTNSRYAIGDDVGFRNIMAINLTETYGENIPDKAYLDAIPYFEGVRLY